MSFSGPDNGHPLASPSSSEQLREAAFALLSQIEQRLNGLSDTEDARVAAAVAECKHVLLEIEADLAQSS